MFIGTYGTNMFMNDSKSYTIVSVRIKLIRKTCTYHTGQFSFFTILPYLKLSYVE